MRLCFPLLLLAAFTANAQVQPADFLAGRWKSDAQFTVKNSDRPEPTYFWVGGISGEISATGKVALKAANGCKVSGLLTPVPNNRTRLDGSLNLTNCAKAVLNRTFKVDANYIAGSLKLTAIAKESPKGKPATTLEVTTTLSRT